MLGGNERVGAPVPVSVSVSVSASISANAYQSRSRSRRRSRSRSRSREISTGFLCFLWSLSVFTSVAQQLVPPPPTLDGHHFKIVVVEETGFVDFDDDDDGGGFSVSGGYCIDVLAAIADPSRANFTYELRSPSGMGSLCMHKKRDDDEDEDDDEDSTISVDVDVHVNITNSHENTGTRSPTSTSTYWQENVTSNISAYAREYRAQYLCGQSDVTDTTLTDSEYAADMYLGLFYVTPERLQQNLFSVSFHPPTTGALTFFGIATTISSVDDLIQQQHQGLQKPVCVQGNTAFFDYIRQSLPDLQTKPFDPTSRTNAFYDSLATGECDIHISDNPVATQFILNQRRINQCDAQGKPIGIITTPLTYGFSQYAIGIRKDMPREVVDTINFWMSMLMTCSPAESSCHSFAQLYPETGGTGNECGYVAFPSPIRYMSPGAIAGLVVGLVVMVVCALIFWLQYRLIKQRKRYKERFVQQIARNITIGPSPGDIPPDKLAEQIKHISGRNGVIAKDDLRRWMFDIKLNFISDEDFEALWNAIDVDRKGVVDSVEFIVFLSLCGPEFEKVHHQIASMPKTERLKFASRRLTNYRLRGEEGVRKMEYDLERRSRQKAVLGGTTSSVSARFDDDCETPTEYFMKPSPEYPIQAGSASSAGSGYSHSSTNSSSSNQNTTKLPSVRESLARLPEEDSISEGDTLRFSTLSITSDATYDA